MIIIKALVSLAFYYNSLRVEDRKDEEYRLFLNEIVDFLYKQIECLQ